MQASTKVQRLGPMPPGENVIDHLARHVDIGNTWQVFSV